MPDLILVPTPSELRTLRKVLADQEERSRWAGRHAEWAFQVCGFGPIASAARASALISRYRPERVMLIGIAGTFDRARVPIGSACRFDTVICDGVGIGLGDAHRGADEAGWSQFAGADSETPIGDTITLESSFVEGVPSSGTLLTCCSASADPPQADLRRRRYSDAVAEDMEGYGVAMACALERKPLQIVRGISNEAGDRDTGRWRIDEALAAAAEMAMRLTPLSWLPSTS